MATPTYTEVLQLVEWLPLEEQQRLLAELAARVHQPVEPLHSIRELHGLGKEIWDGIDAQAYGNHVRDAWHG